VKEVPRDELDNKLELIRSGVIRWWGKRIRREAVVFLKNKHLAGKEDKPNDRIDDFKADKRRPPTL
jgi:hypothetical protein